VSVLRSIDWLVVLLVSWVLPLGLIPVLEVTYFNSLIFWVMPIVALLPPRFLGLTHAGSRRRRAFGWPRRKLWPSESCWTSCPATRSCCSTPSRVLTSRCYRRSACAFRSRRLSSTCSPWTLVADRPFPVEAVLVWLAAPFASVFTFELLKAYQYHPSRSQTGKGNLSAGSSIP
jgi:hypothetical protein